jgi:archaellum component FlaC
MSGQSTERITVSPRGDGIPSGSGFDSVTVSTFVGDTQTDARFQAIRLEQRVGQPVLTIEVQTIDREGPPHDVRVGLYAVTPDGEFLEPTLVTLPADSTRTRQVTFETAAHSDSFEVACDAVAVETRTELDPTAGGRLSVDAGEYPGERTVSVPARTITELFIEDVPETVVAGDSFSLDVQGLRADGEFTDVVVGEEYITQDPGVASVTDVGSVEALNPGVARITVELDSAVGTISDTTQFTVERSQGVTRAPGQPPEPNTVTFPFSIFNALPNIGGAEDFTLRIPTVRDITEIVQTNTTALDPIQQVVQTEVRNLEIPNPLQPFQIRTETRTVFDQLNIPSLSDVTRTVDAELRELDIPEPPSVEEILDPVDDALADVQQDLETSLDELLTDIDQSIASVDRFVQDSIGSLQTTIDSVSSDIDSLSEDFDSGLTDLQSTVDSIDETVPSLESIVSDVTESVIDEIEAQIIPEADGVLLTENVPRFLTITVEDFLQQSLSAETQQNLDDVAQRVSQDVQ